MSDRTAFAPGPPPPLASMVPPGKLAHTICSESFLGYRRSGFALLKVFVLLDPPQCGWCAGPLPPWRIIAQSSCFRLPWAVVQPPLISPIKQSSVASKVSL